MNSEKRTLLPQGQAYLPNLQNKRPERRLRWQWLLSCSLLAIVTCALISSQIRRGNAERSLPSRRHKACPQFPALKAHSPERAKLEQEVEDEISSSDFLNKSVKRMQGAVQIPTESFDGMGLVGKDPRWDIFAKFHEYLENAFPLVYSNLKFTPTNTFGILLEWKGTNGDLKPYLFMAHQDVVPVPAVTVSRWKYPPYSAHYDGRFVWGRGTMDCKNTLIGVLEALETLLQKDFVPERTILAGFGFDEEISGFQGAQHISRHLEESRGRDSIELIVDEGGGIKEVNGALMAVPALGEKGYIDVKVTVETQGGHSSIPPDHTGIGILSQIISTIEASPYEPELTATNPYFTTLQCAAEYNIGMNPWLQKTIQKALTSKKAAKQVANYISSKDKFQRYLMQTSQATDLISGGVKVNALPEKVYAVINHRIAVESRIADVRSKLVLLIEDKILQKFSLSLDAWGKLSGNTSESSLGRVILEDFEPPLEPSPVSPFDTEAYKTFSGTIKQVFGEDTIVAPSLMTGNTDTKFYWNLSKNIYRFSPAREEGAANLHTVDERIGMKEHVEGVKFFAQLILNGDRA